MRLGYGSDADDSSRCVSPVRRRRPSQPVLPAGTQLAQRGETAAFCACAQPRVRICSFSGNPFCSLLVWPRTRSSMLLNQSCPGFRIQEPSHLSAPASFVPHGRVLRRMKKTHSPKQSGGCEFGMRYPFWQLVSLQPFRACNHFFDRPCTEVPKVGV